ncbi:MAG: hypothetical protein ACRDOH_00610 [Streptosporangiaceae bacterium]
MRRRLPALPSGPSRPLRGGVPNLGDITTVDLRGRDEGTNQIQRMVMARQLLKGW